MRDSLSRKYQALRHLLRAYGRVAVALSGGADSALLLKVACVALGSPRVTALHAVSELLPTGETEQASACARRSGCRFHRVRLHPLHWPEFAANPPDRCYHCKKLIYQHFLAHASCDSAPLLDGTNGDDLTVLRPGRRAIAELGVHMPLAAVGLTKREVRLLGKRLGVLSWPVPSSSCLATRIATGEAITPERLQLVRHCEDLLTGLGVAGARVRLAGETATVAVLANDVANVAESDVFLSICEAIQRMGLRTAAPVPLERSEALV